MKGGFWGGWLGEEEGGAGGVACCRCVGDGDGEGGEVEEGVGGGGWGRGGGGGEGKEEGKEVEGEEVKGWDGHGGVAGWGMVDAFKESWMIVIGKSAWCLGIDSVVFDR